MHARTAFPRLVAALALAAPAAALAADGTAAARTEPPAASSLPPGTRLSAADLARHIDAAIDVRLAAEKVRPSPPADDAEFLRRAYLDLTGRVPPADRAAAFLDDRAPDKRAKLVDELLAGTAYGRHQADVWQSLLLRHDSDNRFVQFAPMSAWLEEAFNWNKPWDRTVREILTASGTQEENPAVTYFLTARTPDKVTDNVARLFLGVQLQCAQCHNHPFTGWKQTEYWGMAAFFTRMRTEGNPRPAAQKNGMPLSVHEGGKGRPPRLPESAKVVTATFLGGGKPPESGKDAPLRPALADWLTSPKNPYFSRAMVNRTWAQLFGRGLVNPVDDMHDGNPASHPQLLADLADQFAANDFDVKYLVRAVCNSRTYQRSSKPAAGNAGAAPELYARRAVKVLTPGELFDSLTLVLGEPARPIPDPRNFRGGKFTPPAAKGKPGAARPAAPTPAKGGKPAADKPAATAAPARPFAPNFRELFVAFFRGEDGGEADPTEYQAGVPQVLRLMNGPQINGGAARNVQVQSAHTPAQAAEALYLAALSRRPTPREVQRVAAYVRTQAGDPHRAYADVLWALINSSEFTLNH